MNKSLKKFACIKRYFVLLYNKKILKIFENIEVNIIATLFSIYADNIFACMRLKKELFIDLLITNTNT